MQWGVENLSAYYKNTGKKISDLSYVNDLSDKAQEIIIGVEQGLGSSLGMGLLSKIPYAGPVLAGMGAGGATLEQTLNDENYKEVEYWKKWLYSALSGVGEMAIETISGGVGKVLNKLGLDNAMGNFVAKFSKSATAKETITTLVGTFASEGLEEVASDLVDPFLKSIYNRKSVAENLETDISAESLGTTFLIGGLSGLLSSGGSIAISRAYYSKEGQEIVSRINANKNKIKSAYDAFMKTAQTNDIISQTNAEASFNNVKAEVIEDMKLIGKDVKKLAQKYQVRIGVDSKFVGNEVNALINANPNTLAIKEVIPKLNKIRNNNGQKALNIEYVNDNNQFNGKIVNDTIYLSTDPSKAYRQILSHEIAHTFESNSKYAEIRNDIITALRNSGEFDTAFKNMKEAFEKQNITMPDVKIENDVVAEYIADNFFKSWRNLSKAFDKRSTKDKFVEMIKGLRKQTTDQKLKKQYLDMIQNLIKTDVKEKATTNSALNTHKFSIKSANGRKIVEIDEKSEIAKILSSLPNNTARTKYMKYFLKRNFVGKEISKTFIDKNNQTIKLKISSTFEDVKKLTYRGYFDTMLALSEVEDIIEASKYVGESESIAKDNKTPETDKFKYYYYFDILVKYKSNYWGYELSVGINKETGKPMLYAITNKRKEEADTWVSSPLRTSSNTIISTNQGNSNKNEKFSIKDLVENKNKKYYNNINEYKGGLSDDFRRIQEESRRMSYEEIQQYHKGKELDDEIRRRLSRTFKLELQSSRSKWNYNIRSLLNPKTNKQTNIYENVDGNLFHDIFEIAKKYLENGELVDLHDVKSDEYSTGYEECICYLTEDGLSGFAITKSGDLISVFNLNNERGFLKTISPLVKNNAKTLDCYASPNQDLQKMYTHIFGFKTASLMDYNMEYDHDDIAKNHKMPKVAFMVNTDAEVELKHFDKDSYDEAQNYQLSFVNDTIYSVKNKGKITSDSVKTALSTVLEERKITSSNVKISFDDSASEVIRSLQTVANTPTTDKGYKAKIKTMVREMADSIRFDGKTMKEYFGFANIRVQGARVVNGFRSFKTAFVNQITDRILEESNSNEDSAEILNKFIERAVTHFTDMVNSSDRGRKATIKLVNLKNYFKQLAENSKKYSAKRLESLLESISSRIGKLRFTGTTKLEAEARNIVASIKKDFFENDKVKDFLPKGIEQEYFNQVFKYIESRIEQFKDYEKKPALDVETDIYETYGEQYNLLTRKTEAEIVIDLFNTVKKIVQTANNRNGWLGNNENVNINNEAQSELDKQKAINRKYKNRGILNGVNSYLLSLVDTKAYMTTMSHSDKNSLFSKIYEQLIIGQNKTYTVNQELMKELREYLQTKEGKQIAKRLGNKKFAVEFLGKKIRLGDAISLYMTSKTDNAWSHLVGDGVVIHGEVEGQEIEFSGNDFLSLLDADDIELLDNIKKSSTKAKKSKREELYLEALNRSRNALKQAIGTEYDKLIDILERGYKQSGDYYQEASEKINGFSYGLKKYFYPTKVNPFAFRREIGNADSVANFVQDTYNPSFTKATVKGARNKLQIGDVLGTYYNFVNNLSTYSGVTLEIKNINKFLNAKVQLNADTKTTLLEYMTRNVNNNFGDYLHNLFLAMQGVKTRKDTAFDKGVKWIRSMSAKMALGANLKTFLTQFTSYTRGIIYLSPKNLAKAMVGNKKLKNFQWIMENSPYIANRYLDSNVYNIEALGALDKVNTLTELLMKPIEWADKMPIASMWRACQYETMENGELNLEKAKELFEQVVRDTQAQYDSIGNGSITRIDNEILKGTLMYTSESRKLFSRLYEGVYRVLTTEKGTDEHKQAVGFLGRTTTSLLFGATLVSAISFILKSLKGDYDDKEAEEIIVELIKEDFAGNIIGMFPIFKDIYSYFASGYEIQVGGFSQAIEFLDVFKTYIPNMLDASKTDNERRSALLQAVTKVGHFFGIPIRNLYNDLVYLAGLGDVALDTDMVLKMKNFYYNTSASSLGTLLGGYKKKGDLSKVSAVIEMRFTNYGAGKIEEELADEMARLYMNDSLSSLPSMIPSKITIDDVEIILSSKEKKEFAKIYAEANDKAMTMISSDKYEKLSDEEKASAINKLYDFYYNYAKSILFGTELSKANVLVSINVPIEKFVISLAKISHINNTENLSRKVQVQRHINSTGLKIAEKNLLYYISGYSLTDEKKGLVRSYLMSKGLTYKEARVYLGY